MNMRGYLKITIFFLLFFTDIIFAANAKQEVQKAYYDWCSSIGTAKGDASKITKFYAQNAILFPTATIYVSSAEIRTAHASSSTSATRTGVVSSYANAALC